MARKSLRFCIFNSFLLAGCSCRPLNPEGDALAADLPLRHLRLRKPAGYLSVLVAGFSSPFGFNIDLRDSLPKNANSVFLKFTHPHVIPMTFVLHQYVSMTLCCLWNIIENDWRMLVISQLWARLIFISFYGPNNFSKKCLACFIEEWKSYRFGTTCGWVKNEKKKVAIWLWSDFIFTGCNWFLLLRNPYLLAPFWYCM